MVGADRNFFTIDEQGQFSFSESSPPNFEQPSDSGGDNVYDVTIEVRDDISSVDSLPVTVTVRDVNEPPEVTGQQGLSFAENQSTDWVLATYSATDPEDPSALITRWSTSGTDGGDFTIDENGQLRFRNVPDYERPADSGRDNVYSFSVQGLGRQAARLPAGDHYGDRRERAARHYHHQQDGLHSQGERHRDDIYLQGH